MIITKEDREIEVQPSTLNTYLVIPKGKPTLLISKYSQKYEIARRAAAAIGGIVTNPSWLRSKGVDVRVWEKKPKQPKSPKKTKKVYVPRKPMFVELLTVNGEALIKGF